MKIVYETLNELFSDDAEMRLFQIGPYAPPPPMYTYIPEEKIVLDAIGCLLDKNIETVEEFKLKYPGGVVYKKI